MNLNPDRPHRDNYFGFNIPLELSYIGEVSPNIGLTTIYSLIFFHNEASIPHLLRPSQEYSRHPFSVKPKIVDLIILVTLAFHARLLSFEPRLERSPGAVVLVHLHPIHIS